MALPFICAGQARAGTTWLSTLFSASPEYFAPPVKEWNFLSAIAYVERELTFKEMIENPIAQQALYYKHALASFSEQFAALSHDHFDAPGTREHLRWWRQYLFSDLSIWSYVNLFYTGDRPTFDVSPEYLLIDPNTIATATTRMLYARVIVLLRHPPSRFRSHFSLVKIRGESAVPTFEELDHMHRHSEAHMFISKLATVVDPKLIFIGFADDIRYHADALATALTKFVDAKPLATPKERINAANWHGKSPATISAKYDFGAETRKLDSLLPNNWPQFWSTLPANVFDTDPEYDKAAKERPLGSGLLSDLMNG